MSGPCPARPTVLFFYVWGGAELREGRFENRPNLRQLIRIKVCGPYTLLYMDHSSPFFTFLEGLVSLVFLLQCQVRVNVGLFLLLLHDLLRLYEHRKLIHTLKYISQLWINLMVLSPSAALLCIIKTVH